MRLEPMNKYESMKAIAEQQSKAEQKFVEENGSCNGIVKILNAIGINEKTGPYFLAGILTGSFAVLLTRNVEIGGMKIS